MGSTSTPAMWPSRAASASTARAMSSLRLDRRRLVEVEPAAVDLQAVIAGVDQAVDPDPLPDVVERPPADDADGAIRPPRQPFQGRPRRRGQPDELRALGDRRRGCRRSRGRAGGAMRSRPSPRLHQAPRAAERGIAIGTSGQDRGRRRRGRVRPGGLLGVDLDQRRDDLRRPSVDVVLGHHLAHPPHPAAPLLARHGKRLVHRVGQLLDGERVDQHRVGQLPGGAGELAEDQHAVLVDAAGDELLGDQVHPVVQRADDAELRQPVQRDHLDLVEMALLVDDRPPGIRRPISS